ncbi:MAG: hypothetical protein V4640_01555 [Verrucomicrobiota bacterium]
MTSLIKIQTHTLTATAFAMVVGAAGCEVLDRVLWHQDRSFSKVFDIAGSTLFWGAYLLFWGLLIVGPFRPQTRFSMHGECRLRATHAILALGGLGVLHLWAILMFAMA